MLRLRPALFLAPVLLVVGIAACSRKAEEAAQARADLEVVCKAQKSFLETRKLMRTVAEADLTRERDQHLAQEVHTPLIKEALAEARKARTGKRRKPLDLAATKAGLKGWNCPELDQL